MAPLPSRSELEAMKRVDLQRICKDYGVRANLKSEALIDLLLDTQSTPAPQPVRTRSVSTRIPSKAGPSRVSSMIIHDIDEDEEVAPDIEDIPGEKNEPLPIVPPPRTRKAKELQTRLGVGKPVIAGGQGPRAITKSSGSFKSRGLRAKSSKTMIPVESTIEEETEPPSITSKAPPHLSEDKQSSHGAQSPTTTSNSMDHVSGMIDVKKIVEDAIRPLQAQIQGLKSELNQMNAIKSDIAHLQVQVADVCKVQEDTKSDLKSLHELLEMVLSLKEEVKQLREDSTSVQNPSRPSTPKPKSSQPRPPPIGFGIPPAFRAVPPLAISDRQGSSNQHPGIAKSTLGKRPRNSSESNIIERGEEEDYSESELAKKVVSPTKKRARTDGFNRASTSSREGEDADAAGPSRPFTIFTGSEEHSNYVDPPPPTDHLPDLFEVEPSPSSSSNRQGAKLGVPTSSANAAENQQLFGFSYPMSSTPQNPMYMSAFPYPEPPQSPSPAGPSSNTFMGRQNEERTDIFKTFGLPSPLRAGRHYGSLQDERGGFVNPAALSNQGTSGKQREVSSNDVAAGLGLTAIRTTSSSDPSAAPTGDTPPTKRTMYGTELESDTRFGDFGVEGVASGFWTSGKF